MKLNKNILFINFAIGATCVDQWKIKNQYFKRMIKKIDDFKNKTQLNIDYFVYHQGECDNNKNTPLKIYLSSLTQIFSQLHNKYKSKIILNIASRTVFKKDINITKAQYLVIKDNKFVYEGVNTDIKLKDMDYRFGVHFSKKGLERFGELLSYKLIKLEGVQ